jgi:hypothetical protein
MDDTTKQILQAALAGLVRHGMTTAAGALVAAGLLQSGDSANFEQIGSGLVLGVVALAWSWWQKAGQAKVAALLKSAAAPAAPVKSLVIVAALCLAAAPWSAHAQTREAARAVPAAAAAAAPTTNCLPLDLRPECQTKSAATSSETPQQVWQQIIAAATADLTYAKALADNAATPNSKLRSTCYAALIAANQQANGVNLKNTDGSPMSLPDPAVITRAEQGLELIDNLQPSSPLVVACAPAANAVRMGVLAFVNTVVTGAALKAASGGILP